MDALVVTPGAPGSARLERRSSVGAAPGLVLLRPLEVGVCGTDREIAAGLFGVPPEGEADLVLGHELLAEVAEDAGPFTRGDLVSATIRRSCGRCAACAAGSVDACLTGDYLERGITRLHGFAAELVAESAEHLVPIPAALGRLGVLAEPASVCVRGLRHAEAVGTRQVWEPRRALVVGAGAIGVLATALLRLGGREVWTVSREPAGSAQTELVEATGAAYVPAGEGTLGALAAEVGGFDLVVEAAGDAAVMAEAPALLRRSGVALLLGIDGHAGAVPVDRRTLGVELVVGNRAVVGSVNAHPEDWAGGVAALVELRRRWPEAADGLVGLRVEPDRFEEAFAFRGVKATLRFA